MNALLADLRYAFRNFAKSPGFTAAVILSLAIGIGANASIFSITDDLLLRPLPYKNSDRLVILWNRSPGLNILQDWFSPAQYFDIKNGHSGFEQVAIAIGGNFNLTGSGDPERIGAIRISSNLLPMLGVNAIAGRLFTPEEDSPGRADTAILTYGMWANRFGSDPHMLGKSLIINGVTYEVAGILPKSFSLPREVLPILYGTDHADLFLPLPMGADAPQHRGNEDYNVLGTLKRGVTVAQAQAEMDALGTQYVDARDTPAHDGGGTESNGWRNWKLARDDDGIAWLVLDKAGSSANTLNEAHDGRFLLGLGVSHAPIVNSRGHDYGRPLSAMRG